MNNFHPVVSFDNTQRAFQHKTDHELKKARFLFGLMSNPIMVKIGATLTPWAIRAGLPIKGLIRKTLFAQFIGGENLEQTAAVAKKLALHNVKVILDYGVEGKEGEENFDNACKVFLKVIDHAASEPNIPFMSVKVTGFARFGLLELLHQKMKAHQLPLLARYEAMLFSLSSQEREEWERVCNRVETVCVYAASKNIYTEKEVPQPQVLVAFGLLKVNPRLFNPPCQSTCIP
jgi:proline dehydrogenase